MPNSKTISLFLAGLASFALISYVFANDPTQIIEGRGSGSIIVGAKRKQVEAVLGQPTRQKEYSDVYFADYPSKGIQVVYQKKDDTVNRMYFFNKAYGYEAFISYPGKTARGAGWETSAEEVLKIYGEPANDFKDDADWRRIVFEGIDFYFEKGKLVRICVPGE